MIGDLKPNAAYKDSGLPWLGQVPGHWGQRRMKFLFGERTQKGFPDDPLLAATQTKGVVRKDAYGKRNVTAMKDFHLLTLVEIGDFVISLRSFEGGIEVSHCRGIISQAYTVLKSSDAASLGYFSRFFKSADFIRRLTLFVAGLQRQGQGVLPRRADCRSSVICHNKQCTDSMWPLGGSAAHPNYKCDTINGFVRKSTKSKLLFNMHVTH